MPRPKDIDTPEGRQRYEEKYERILDAALQVFASKGFYEAKVSEIARTAGVADGTIYLYFKNKDEVLLSVFESELRKINTGLRDRIGDSTDPLDRLEKSIRYHLELAETNPPFAQFITVELRRSTTFMRDYAKGGLKEWLDIFAEIFKDGKERGVFRSDFSAGMAAQVLFGALDYATLTWVNNPNREPDDLVHVGDFLVQVVTRALCQEQ